MPKAAPHFDVAALLTAVAQQDVGLVVSTNDPDGFRRIVYQHMRAQPSLRCHVYAAPASARSFWLLRQPAPSVKELETDLAQS